jgi:hypothetical protein
LNPSVLARREKGTRHFGKLVQAEEATGDSSVHLRPSLHRGPPPVLARRFGSPPEVLLLRRCQAGSVEACSPSILAHLFGGCSRSGSNACMVEDPVG